MTFHIITIFPKIFDSYFNESIIKRAQKNKLINIKIHNLRDWTADKHKTVDDAPFGGGAGMVMKIEPLYKALQNIALLPKNVLPMPEGEIKRGWERGVKLAPFNKGGKGDLQIMPSLIKRGRGDLSSKTILLSAKGKTWNQKLAKSHAKLDNLILICGRYEGVDERITKFIDEEISIGNYVLTGGEIGALAIVDSITRLLPGALGNADSAKNESHTTPGVLEHPQYTRPEVFITSPLTRGARGVLKGRGIKKLSVPKVLLSGNHKKIEEWRKKHNKSSHRILPP